MSSEPWIPIRTIHRWVTCASCFGDIAPAKPGARTGERGTRAWMLRGARVVNLKGVILLGPTLFQCLVCHDQDTTTELATGT